VARTSAPLQEAANVDPTVNLVSHRRLGVESSAPMKVQLGLSLPDRIVLELGHFLALPTGHALLIRWVLAHRHCFFRW
jgi:hypothetical protein